MDPWLLRALPASDLAHRLEVSDRQARRWKTQGLPRRGPARVALRLLDGDLGAWHGAWAGWWIDGRDGRLVAPNGEAVTAGDVAAYRLERQRLWALDREARRLRAALDDTGRAHRMSPARLVWIREA